MGFLDVDDTSNHYLFMIFFTIYSVYIVELGIQSVNGNNGTLFFENFVYGFRWVSFCCGCLYGLIGIRLLSAKFRKRSVIFTSSIIKNILLQC